MEQRFCQIPRFNNRDAVYLLIIFAIGLLFQWPVVCGKMPLDEDSLLFYYPLRALHSDPVVGLWDPYQFCGFPRDANPQSQILYFPNIVFLFLPTHAGFCFLLVVHYILGGVLMYGLLRGLMLYRLPALFGSLVFLLGTFWRCKIVNLGLLEGIAWVPAVLFFFLLGLEKRLTVAWLASSIFLALVIMAGMPHPAIYTILFLLFIAAGYAVQCKKPLRIFAGSLLITVGGAALLSAGVWIPALIYSFDTMRLQLPLDEAIKGALGWQDIWKVFLGGLAQKDISRLEPWEGTCVIGSAALFFCFMGWKSVPSKLRAGLSAAFIFSLACTMGYQGWIFPFLFKYLPGWSFLNLPNRSLMLAAFVLPVFAAFGLQRWFYDLCHDIKTMIGLCLAAVVSLSFCGYLAWQNPWIMETMLHSGLTREIAVESISSTEWALLVFFFWIGITTLILFITRGCSIRPRFVMIILSILITGQSLQISQRLFLNTGNHPFLHPPKTVQVIRHTPQYTPFTRILSYEPEMDFEGDVRVWSVRPALAPRLSEIYGVSEIQGYDPMVPKRYAELIRAWGGQNEDSDARRRIRLKSISPTMLNFFGAQYVIGHPGSQIISKRERSVSAPGRYRMDLLKGQTYESFGFRWLMKYVPHLSQGEQIGAIHFRKKGNAVESFPIRMGIEISNFVLDDPEEPAKHKSALEYRWIPGQYEKGYLKIRQYRCELKLSQPKELDDMEIELTQSSGDLVLLELDGRTTDHKGLALLSDQAELPVYINPSQPVLAYFSRLTKNYDRVEDIIDCFNRLDPQQEIPVFVDLADNINAGGSPVIRTKPESLEFHLKREYSDRIEMDVETMYDGIIAVHENYSPYWQAKIDDKIGRVFRANYAFMGCLVNTGKHHLVFEYKPYPFYLGCAVSGVALVGILALIFMTAYEKWVH